MPQPDRQRDADAYRALLERIRQSCGCAEADDEQPLPGELEIQALWHAGLLGNCGETMRHGRVRILDFGEWNRSAGPDFQRAEIEIDGIRHHGDIEIGLQLTNETNTAVQQFAGIGPLNNASIQLVENCTN